MKKILLLLAVLPLLTLCKQAEKRNLVEDNFRFAEKQLTYAVEQIEVTAKIEQGEASRVFPRTIDSEGELVLSYSSEWTSGFFPGSLWYMYEYTGDDKWRELASEYTSYVEEQKRSGWTHDTGFKIYCSFGNGYRLTNDEHYRDVLLEAAETLSGRYSPTVGLIRSWDHNSDRWDFPVIIDNLMNLELLFWASKESGDQKYYNIAVDHVNATMKNHYRENMSTYHVVDYNPRTGEVQMKCTHQGYADDSSWARGEAWSLYGLTMCYRESGDERYLKRANSVASYLFAHPNRAEDFIPYWDYEAPDIANEPRDASAAAIMASALYELSEYVEDELSKHYRGWADNILVSLTNHYRATVGEDGGFLLLHATGHKPGGTEIDVPIVYADYYFLEALLRKDRIEKEETI